LPERLEAALERSLPATADEVRGAASSGNPFVDERYAELRGPELIALHADLARAARRAGKSFVAPFLEPELAELVFALPPELLLAGGRTMQLFGLGEPLAVSARHDAAAGATALEGVLEAGRQLLGLEPERVLRLGPTARDRLAGLGLYARAHR
jgi:hypothetical protein